MSDAVLYAQLRTTAIRFIESTNFDQQTAFDASQLQDIVTGEFEHSWGHKVYTSSRADLNSVINSDRFTRHLSLMVENLDAIHAHMTDCLVDVSQRAVAARASHIMTPKGARILPDGSRESVENDLVWLLRMDETGTRVKQAIEFIDGDASARIGYLIATLRSDD